MSLHPELPTPANPADQRVRKVEILISNLLRIGVVTSLSIVVIGTLITFLRHPDYVRSQDQLQRLTSPSAAFPHTLRDVADEVIHLRGRAFVMLGLLLLIATPVLRVAVSILAFVYQKDRIFIVITSIVLALLLLSFVLGKASG